MRREGSANGLAIFGGEPLFREPKPFGQLAQPDMAHFLRLVRKQYESTNATGDEPLAQELEDRLCAFHMVSNCITVTNACLALVLLMRVLARGKRGNVIIPAFSYAGLPHLAQWAAQLPRFADVNARSHALDAGSVLQVIDAETTSILAVCNVQDTTFIGELSELARQRGVAIIFDSVPALGSTYRQRPLGSNGQAEVFSLHATKMLNGFEGGYITTNDGGLADVLRTERGRIGAYLGEIPAAMALVSLEGLPQLIARNQAKFRSYEHLCRGIHGIKLLPYANAEEERYNFQLAILDVEDGSPLTRDEMVRVMRAEGALVAPYYSPPLHRSSHCPPGLTVGSMPTAETLARRFLYLPSGEHTSLADIEAVGALLAFLVRNGDSIARRLRAA